MYQELILKVHPTGSQKGSQKDPEREPKEHKRGSMSIIYPFEMIPFPDQSFDPQGDPEDHMRTACDSRESRTRLTRTSHEAHARLA